MSRPADAAPADEALMLAYASGDALAFEMLFDRHNLRLWRYLRRSAGTDACADDLAQDVWLNVARAATSYRAQSNARFSTWLFTLAHNRLVDHWRASRPVDSLDQETDSGERLLDQLAADSGFGPLRQLESRQQAMQLLAALDALPPEQREAFLLQAEAGMRVAEIATATAVPLETAKSRLRYARKAMRQVLEAP
ncbi:MAG: sigma-70 family RNA polymerase sigma factor [Burkholderiaceae bacterium]|nr:sigma-70 family RNA polymerase sigma factor [Burkholderiaceae bacterium]